MAETTTQIVQSQEEPWMSAERQALISKVKEAVLNAPEKLPEYQVADLTKMQKDAAKLAASGIGAYLPYITRASDVMGTGVDYLKAGTQAYDPNSVAAYMNPYQQQVTQNALAEMNRQAQIQQQSVASNAVMSGAFGGSRFGVQQAELGRNLADVQSARIMQDYAQNYSQAQQAAMNAFQNQQARYQSAGQSLGTLGQGIAGLGQMTSALGQGDASFLYNMGANMQGQQQKLLDATRMNTALYNAEPYQRLSYYADILNKTPSGQMQMTQTTAPSPSPFSQIAGIGIAGLGAYNMGKTAGFWG
jgi:hypothetical protein